MMNDLKLFSNSEFGELGVLMIDGKEWFPAHQCAKILGYSNPRDAVRRHCKTEGVVKHDGVSYTTNQHGVTTQQVTEIKYINEGNLYRLIVSSKLPAAEKFEKWVFEEVLPSIRKNGSYGNINIEQVIAQTATAVVSEVVKQLVPVLTKSMVVSEEQEVIREVKTSTRRRHPCIITKLSVTLRNHVDSMLLNGSTYREVVDFLAINGVAISNQSVCTYYNNYLA